MPETIELPDGHSAQIRTELTGADERWFLTEREKIMKANGTAKPAVTGPDPDNPAILKTTPAVPASITIEDSFVLFDMTIARLVTSCTMPGVLPWSAAVRDGLDLDVVNALDTAAGLAQRRMQGLGPKRPKTGPTSAASSSASATAPQTEPIPEPSGTASE